jgi:hypothetical protein
VFFQDEQLKKLRSKHKALISYRLNMTISNIYVQLSMTFRSISELQQSATKNIYFVVKFSGAEFPYMSELYVAYALACTLR